MEIGPLYNDDIFLLWNYGWPSNSPSTGTDAPKNACITLTLTNIFFFTGTFLVSSKWVSFLRYIHATGVISKKAVN